MAAIGGVHFLLMLAEVFPWPKAALMGPVIRKWPYPLDLSNKNDMHLLAMVVHNAGIYNGIVGAGLFATLYAGEASYPAQVTLLAGGIVAGIFGFFTLSKATILQAVLGAVALGVLVSGHASPGVVSEKVDSPLSIPAAAD